MRMRMFSLGFVSQKRVSMARSSPAHGLPVAILEAFTNDFGDEADDSLKMLSACVSLADRIRGQHVLP